jgi:hypothetical protein
MTSAPNIELLILVQTDPRRSPRPAEAIRLACGLGSWGSPRVALGLRGPAVRILHYEDEVLLDDHQFRQGLPIIAGWNQPVLVDADSVLPRPTVDCGLQLVSLTEVQWAQVLLTVRYTLRF